MPEISAQEVLKTVLSRRQKQAEFTKENFNELIDEVIEEFQADGIMTDDEDVEFLKSQVRGHWDEVNNSS